MYTHLTKHQKWMFAGSAPFVAGAVFTLAAVATPASASTTEMPRDPPRMIVYEVECPGERTNSWQVVRAGPVTDISVYVDHRGSPHDRALAPRTATCRTWPSSR